MGYDVLAFGEGLLRIQPAGDGRIEDAHHFFAYPGGAELNTCCALAGLGIRCAWFSVLPPGPLAGRLLRHLRAADVDVSLVRTQPGRVGTYWVEYGREPRGIEVLYDRRDSTVTAVRHEDAPWQALRESRLFFVSGITLALSPDTRRLALEMAAAARAAGVRVATDLNYRARLWSVAEAAPVLEQLARSAEIVITTEEDLGTLFGWQGEPETLARRAQEHFGCATLALTRGGGGAVCADAEALHHCAVFPAARIDRIGAGDAFSAGFLYAKLTGRDARALEYGLGMAALKHSLAGDTVSTSVAEIEHILARAGSDIRR